MTNPESASSRGRNLSRLRVRRLTYAALYLAIAMVLPFLTGQIPQIGAMLSPMHIPVFLCGFLCGWPWGLAVGLIAPLLRSVLFGMPAMFPTAVAMTFELAVYGGLSGFLHRRLRCPRPDGFLRRHLPAMPASAGSVYAPLIIAMLAGRAVWGAARVLLAGLSGSGFTWAMFLAGAFTSAVPGIILHILLIPPLVIAMERAGLGLNQDPE